MILAAWICYSWQRCWQATNIVFKLSRTSPTVFPQSLISASLHQTLFCLIHPCPSNLGSPQYLRTAGIIICMWFVWAVILSRAVGGGKIKTKLLCLAAPILFWCHFNISMPKSRVGIKCVVGLIFPSALKYSCFQCWQIASNKWDECGVPLLYVAHTHTYPPDGVVWQGLPRQPLPVILS